MEPTEEQLQNLTPEQLAELQKQNCIFCHIGAGKIPAKKLYEDEDVFAVLDINPAAQGHILLLTREHYAVLPQVPEPIVHKLFVVSKMLSQKLLKGLKARATDIFIANGMIAGQKAPHVMVHIIPRKEGDGITIAVPKGSVGEAEQKTAKQKLQAVLAGKKDKLSLEDMAHG